MFDEILTFALSTEKGRRLGIAMLILFSLLFFCGIISTIHHWYADTTLARSQPAVDTPQLNEAVQLIAQIPQQHLFGQSAAEADFLPISSLQYRLIGTVKMPEEHLSRAMISSGGEMSKVYHIGDELVSGIKIYAINADNIVLEHEGRFEKLPLSRATLLFQDAPASIWQG